MRYLALPLLASVALILVTTHATAIDCKGKARVASKEIDGRWAIMKFRVDANRKSVERMVSLTIMGEYRVDLNGQSVPSIFTTFSNAHVPEDEDFIIHEVRDYAIGDISEIVQIRVTVTGCYPSE